MIDFNTATNEVIKKYFEETYKDKKNSLELFKEIAQLRGGECLSTFYLDNKTHLEFRCKHNHIFNSQPITVKKGVWCAQCANKTKMKHITQNNKNDFINRIENLHLKLIGELNSTKKESIFECEKGHRFSVIGRYLYRNNYKCPICIKNK